jgi:hypothetical protein
MNLQFSNFFAAPETETGGSSEETFELLNVEDEPEVLELPKAEPKEEDEEEKTEEVDELKELEEELEEPKEEDLLEITTPVRRKEILSKYPKLFKDFPYLEKAYYREQQFTEILPTIQDAREAVEKAKVLDQTERQVMGGDLSQILAAAKQEDGEAFNRIADNYLHSLRQADQQAYYHVLGNVIKDTIITMVREGRNLGEQGAPLQAAANILNQFVFGSQQFEAPKNLSKTLRPEDQDREQRYAQQDRERAYQQFDSVRNDLQTRADNVLKGTIDGHIDPRGTMTDYVKKHATQEAFQDLETLISKDARFRSLLDRLWEKAHESGYDRTSTEKIKSAYLSKAKTLLPSVIKKARTEALRGRSKVEADEEEEETLESTPKKSPVSLGKSTSPRSSGKFKKPSDIPKGMSTLDVLNSD